MGLMGAEEFPWMEDFPQRYKITEIYPHERRTFVNSFRSPSFHLILPPLPTLLMDLEGGLQGGLPSPRKFAEKPLFFRLSVGELPTPRKVAYNQALRRVTKGIHRRARKKPTVGRLTDLP